MSGSFTLLDNKPNALQLLLENLKCKHSKIRQSSVDSILIGNWNMDFSPFMRALQNAKLHQVKRRTHVRRSICSSW